jgi:hypothetical protein
VHVEYFAMHLPEVRAATLPLEVIVRVPFREDPGYFDNFLKKPRRFSEIAARF